jgi:hypothetical protein
MSAGRRKLIISLDFNIITPTNGNHHFYSWNIDNYLLTQELEFVLPLKQQERDCICSLILLSFQGWKTAA